MPRLNLISALILTLKPIVTGRQIDEEIQPVATNGSVELRRVRGRV
jgi:hypothetical protein